MQHHRSARKILSFRGSLAAYTATEEEGNTEHGNDARIRVEEVPRGPRILFDVVAAVAGSK